MPLGYQERSKPVHIPQMDAREIANIIRLGRQQVVFCCINGEDRSPELATRFRQFGDDGSPIPNPTFLPGGLRIYEAISLNDDKVKPREKVLSTLSGEKCQKNRDCQLASDQRRFLSQLRGTSTLLIFVFNENELKQMNGFAHMLAVEICELGNNSKAALCSYTQLKSY